MEKISSLLIFVAGLHSVGFAIFHIYFWKIFKWKTELLKMTIANRAIIQIFNVLGIFLFFFMAFLCFRYENELLTTPLGKVILGFCAGFWLIRLITQFIFLRVNHKIVHTLSVLFFIGFLLFLLPILLN